MGDLIDFRGDGVFIYIPVPQTSAAASEGRERNEIIEGTLYLIIRDRIDVFIEWRPVLVDVEKQPHLRPKQATYQQLQQMELAEDNSASLNSENSSLANSHEHAYSKGYLDKLRRVAFSVELRELNSIKQQLTGDHPRLTLIQRDGTTMQSLHFHEDNVDLFFQALQRHIQLYRAIKDNDLLIVRHHDPNALQNTWNQLNLFQDNRVKFVAGFIRDPYGTALGGLAKVGGIFREMVQQPTNSSSIDEIAEIMGDLPGPNDLPVSTSRHAPSGHGTPTRGSRGQTPEAVAFDANSETLSPMMQAEPSPDVAEEAGFEVLYKVQVPPRLPTKRGLPLSLDQWLTHFDRDGRVRDLDRLLDAIFRGGLAQDSDGTSVRRDAYKFLLDYYPWDSTDAERAVIRQKKHIEYRQLKQQWMLITADQESRWALFRDRKCLVEKDVMRTDRTMEEFKDIDSKALKQLSDILMTYIMYNFDLGYVQGMNDLLAPLLLIMQDEADAFWCFVGFMNLIGKNFEMDQKEMKDQLNNLYHLLQVLDPSFAAYLDSNGCSNMYFCFRWLLVWFKREFNYADTLRIWEVMWTRNLCPKNFHLLACLAILDQHKVVIMENHFGLTEILKHVNDLAMKLDVDDVLKRAEGIFIQFCGCSELPAPVKNILGL